MNLEKSNKKYLKLVNLGYSILVNDNNNCKFFIKNILQNVGESFVDYLDVIEVTICIQSEKKLFDNFPFKELQYLINNFDVNYVWGGSKGVAKSRNIIIEKANAKYIHFLDSDCRFNNIETYNYINKLKYSESKLIFFKSEKSNFNRSKSFISYTNNLFPFLYKNRFLMFLRFSVSSATYNIIINKNFCFKFINIRFDKRLGLGGELQQSDEILFLLNLWKYLPKRGFSILISNHFKAISKSHMAKFSNINLIVKSKGYVLGKFFGELGLLFIFPLIILFFIKYKDDINFFKTFYFISQGFIYGLQVRKIDL